MEVLSLSTLVPVGFVISLLTFSYFLGGQARKLKDQGDRIEKLETRMDELEDVGTKVAVLAEKISSIEAVLAEIRADLKTLLKT